MAQRNLSRPVSRVGADERPRTRWTREERPLTRGLAEDRPSIPESSATMRRGSAATTSGDDPASSRPISRRGAQEINRVINKIPPTLNRYKELRRFFCVDAVNNRKIIKFLNEKQLATG
jgi:hypothetical protein